MPVCSYCYRWDVFSNEPLQLVIIFWCHVSSRLLVYLDSVKKKRKKKLSIKRKIPIHPSNDDIRHKETKSEQRFWLAMTRTMISTTVGATGKACWRRGQQRLEIKRLRGASFSLSYWRRVSKRINGVKSWPRDETIISAPAPVYNIVHFWDIRALIEGAINWI